MNNNCKDIEIRIVDYFEDLMNSAEKAELLEHIKGCQSCRIKFDEFEKAQSLIRDDSNLPIIQADDLLFEEINKNLKRKKVLLRIVFVAASIVIIILSSLMYANYSYQNKLKEAQNLELSLDYFTDIEEEIINSDDETFEVVSQLLYGNDYVEFENILEETSIIKP